MEIHAARRCRVSILRAWAPVPSCFFPTKAFYTRDYIAAVPGGALVIGGEFPLNRFSAAERFFEH
jgi:hypothetical protein